MRISCVLIVVAFLSSFTEALKILMAGDMTKEGREYFFKVAQRITENPQTTHTVFFMTPELATSQKEKVTDRLYRYGIGNMKEFKYDISRTEESNYNRLDVEMTETYFQQATMTFDLKKGMFDMGIGGLYLADSLLFRDLQIPYIKISEEDIESYAMQKKLNMPVLTSTYPSSHIWSRFQFHKLPDFASFDYRFPFFLNYVLNRYMIYSHNNDMRAAAGSIKSYLFDDYDQDHALVIGQGTRAGLYQSIMMKPPNVRYVYPLTPERKTVEIPEHLQDDGALIIFNIKYERHDDLMQDREQQAIMRTLVHDTIQEGIGMVIIAPPSLAESLKQRFSLELSTRLMIVEAKDPHTIKLVNPKTEVDQYLIWVSSCTQRNFISGIGVHKAIMIGYAFNQYGMAQNTQKFNCHKVSEFEVGLVSLSQGLSHPSQVQVFKSLIDKSVPEIQEMLETIEFYSDILQNQAESSMDIEYWIDYLNEFGIAHKIPLYDHMSLFKYYNMDIWIPVSLVVYLIYWLIKSMCKCCCRKICCSSKVEDDKKEKKE